MDAIGVRAGYEVVRVETFLERDNINIFRIKRIGSITD